MKTTFRSKVFKRAHEIMKSTGKNFAVCLSKAWAVYRLAKKLTKGAVKFSFEKKDGSLKTAIGTLKSIERHIKGTGAENNKTLAYWDIQANAFRSFIITNLITVY